MQKGSIAPCRIFGVFCYPPAAILDLADISHNAIFSPLPPKVCEKSTASRHKCEITKCWDLLGLGSAGPNPKGPNASAPWVWGSLLNGIGRKFRARVFAPGFHFFLNTGSLPIPQVWRNKTHIIFRRRKILKWKLIFNQCNQISNRNTASFLLYKFQLSFNHNRLYFLSCCCSDSSLLTPKL